MSSYVDSYPYLENLIGGWFHQDFDLAGDTLEEILADYKEETPPEDLAGLIADIRRFQRHTQGDLDQALELRFHPGVLPTQWGLSTGAWLDKLVELMS